ncbi:uncharacterized protein DFL_006680 [Arthrobotrys flagrans]|uniref:Uncharacterized protein n=1 Tax=Arthrobotrys flagrans TaxID=97331 RepID=A0A436ZTK9_ARTFL|nr:hypothetical protein DFL_006680 [Arthrobotrys flagrans]
MDPQEESIGVAGVVSTSRKRRRLSSTCSKDSLEPITSVSDISSLNANYRGSKAHIPSEIYKPMESSSRGSDGCGSGRFQLLAFGCNVYGQLIDGPGWRIETKWKATEVYTDWLKNENADRDDTPAEPTRGPNLFTSVDTPTVVMTARESMRVLYVGNNSICVERDGNIYLRGLLPTLAPGNSRRLRELAIPLPLGVQAHNVTKSFGTRWAFLGLILSDGSVCTFSLSEHLYDASLQSLSFNTTSPISTFNLDSDYPGEGVLQQDIFKSIASTSTGFIALTSNSNIYTYGDKRFNSLGRSPDATIASTTSSNAQGWGQVTALEGIVIEHISANSGGHVQGALAEDGTVYIWGGDGTENINVSLTSGTENVKEDEEVAMVDIVSPETNEPVGFDGVNVGEDYVVLVEEGGKGIWVSGGSDMGQTGFGREYRCLPTALEVDEEIKRRKGIWRKLDLGILEGGMKIRQVSCGSGYTIILLDSNIGT